MKLKIPEPPWILIIGLIALTLVATMRYGHGGEALQPATCGKHTVCNGLAATKKSAAGARHHPRPNNKPSDREAPYDDL